MSDQPNALRLAKLLEDIFIPVIVDRQQAAAELRRLHEVNQELLEALKELLQDTQHVNHNCGDEAWCPVIKARAAIAKGEQA